MAEIEQLRQDFEAHRADSERRWQEVLDAQLEVKTAVQELAKNTEGVVTLYNDLQGAARVGIALQKFVVWCSKWGLLGTIAAAAVSWLVEHYAAK